MWPRRFVDISPHLDSPQPVGRCSTAFLCLSWICKCIECTLWLELNLQSNPHQILPGTLYAMHIANVLVCSAMAPGINLSAFEIESSNPFQHIRVICKVKHMTPMGLWELNTVIQDFLILALSYTKSGIGLLKISFLACPTRISKFKLAVHRSI